jgi:hypothetical protein
MGEIHFGMSFIMFSTCFVRDIIELACGSWVMLATFAHHFQAKGKFGEFSCVEISKLHHYVTVSKLRIFVSSVALSTDLDFFAVVVVVVGTGSFRIHTQGSAGAN